MKNLKKLAALAIALGLVGTTAFSFAGCFETEGNQPPENQESTVNPGDDTDSDPENPPVDNNREDPPVDNNREDPSGEDEPTVDREQLFNEAVARVNAFFDSMAETKNFTCTDYTNVMSDYSGTAYVDGVTAKIESDGVVYYYSLQDGTNYIYTLGEDGYWHKNLTEEADSLTKTVNLIARLKGIVWSDYDVDAQSLNGTYENMSLTARFDEDGKFLMHSIRSGETEDITIESVGMTSVALPEDVIDDTAEKLYDAQGNLNSTLLAEAIVDWLNESGYYKNVVAKATGKYVTFDKIDFIDFDEENGKVEFGVYNIDTATGSPAKKHMSLVTYYQPFADKLLNGDFKNYTYDDFKDYLDTNYSNYPLNQKDSNKTLESYTLDDEMTEQERADLITIGENILTRLAEIGYQGYSINNEGTKVTDYVGATILNVRKDKDVSQGSALDMGTVSSANFYITITKTNGAKEILTLGLSYVTNGLSQNVLENTKEDSWIIRSYSSKEIDYCPYAYNGATA